MAKDDLDSITAQLENLELAQQIEVNLILEKHRQQKQELLRRLTRKKSTKPKAPLSLPPPIVSASGIPLRRGDTVIIETTATIGCKGDLATVTKVEPKKVHFHVPRLNDRSWRLPKNVSHHHSSIP